MDTARRRAKKIAIGIVGGIVVCVGIVAIPYPGPGWLIVFAGLAILSSEFEWAHELLQFGRGKYDDWQAWLAGQSRPVQALFWCLTATIVVATIWLLNGYGFANKLLGLGWNWVDSPLPIPGK